MKKITVVTIILFMISSITFGKELVQVILITRHGDRAPFTKIENANYKWGTALSELTPLGMNQEYQLGQKLRNRYINKFKLLKPNYEPLSIYTVSSHSNRTVLSAECLLTGLYPPGTGPALNNGKAALPEKIQFIPIMTLPENSHLIMFPYKEYLGVLKKYIYNSEVWKNKENELRHDFEKWSKILGNKITTLNDIIDIGDVLIVAKAHHKELPKGLSEKDAEKIINLRSWALALQFKDQRVAYIQGNELINQILDDNSFSAF